MSRGEGAREGRERLKREGGADQDPGVEAGEPRVLVPLAQQPRAGPGADDSPLASLLTPRPGPAGGLAGLPVPRSADTAPLFRGPVQGGSGQGPRLAGKGPSPCPSLSSSLDRQDRRGQGRGEGGGVSLLHIVPPQARGPAGSWMPAPHPERGPSHSQQASLGFKALAPLVLQQDSLPRPPPAVPTLPSGHPRTPRRLSQARERRPQGTSGLKERASVPWGLQTPPCLAGWAAPGKAPRQHSLGQRGLSSLSSHPPPTPTAGPAALESLLRPPQAKCPSSPVVCLQGHHARGKHSPPTLRLTEDPRGEVAP